jgi:precorrin-2 dehydrogenase/sirohydrochlorin ferrochelatase
MVLMIPLMIDLSGRSVVIFGGGDVGARKAAFFCHEADVTVISRSFSPLFDNLSIRRSFADVSRMPDNELLNYLSGAFLAIAATSEPALNDRIGARCRELGILFNNADGTGGSVLLPAVSRGDQYLLAVSTGGQSPAVARYLRELIERECPALDDMIALQARLRTALKPVIPDQEQRSRILRDVIEDPAIWKLLEKKPEEVWNIVAARYLHG